MDRAASVAADWADRFARRELNLIAEALQTVDVDTLNDNLGPTVAHTTGAELDAIVAKIRGEL